MYDQLSEREEEIGKFIVNAAYKIHKSLGPGLLESVYVKCFCHELQLQGFNLKTEVQVPIYYEGLKIDDGLRLDVLVEEMVIIEFKAQQLFHPVWQAQLLSYLKLSNLRLGYIINFHVPLIKDGIKRLVV